ncbi:MAG TPA: ATP-dependent DNA ligase [Acidimicrobiia bacterium]|nr:ATP-dependent DNA ligase [Acidimicrobiia bacterium]
MTWPFPPPIETMEAKVMESWPSGSFAFEPKWDGFRAVSWSGTVPRLDSRNQKPLLRYFPELTEPLTRLPEGTVVDGEVVVVIDNVTNFDALQQRIHPAVSRINLLSKETPAQLIAFDLLAHRGDDLRTLPFTSRREKLEELAAEFEYPWSLTPSTTDLATARAWFDDFESAGCDGIIAKPLQQGYVHGKRAMIKIKHRRTADCVVGGYREHKDGGKIGSLLLGLYNSEGELHFIGHCSGFGDVDRTAIFERFQELRADASFGDQARVPGGISRWTGQKDLSWIPILPGVVVEISYDQLEEGRFRHATRFHRWRPDKEPESCTMDQLERPAGTGFAEVVAR